jgi:hypothetical protein
MRLSAVYSPVGVGLISGSTCARTVKRSFGTTRTLAVGIQHHRCGFDGLLGTFAGVYRSLTKLLRALPQQRRAYSQPLFTLVGLELTLIRHPLALISHPFALVSLKLTQVG